MSLPAIKVEGLWKEYVVGSEQHGQGTFYDLLTQTIRAPFKRLREFGGRADEGDRFWALRELEFEVRSGEVLGVIGRNGAGKSTLLKVLSRITAPTRGKVTLRGRLASLLEVGTGFHPELTGRENIHLNATILGMGKREVDRKFDAIVAFADVDKFLDTPVKRYSSGMYVRLAFAVAAHVEADILLVDEVLAVGDAEFQKRCLGMMGDVARGGRTVLFVSHNLTALRNLCTTGLLLDHGQAQACGPIGEVLNRYASSRAVGSGMHVELSRGQSDAAASIRRVGVELLDGSEGDMVSVSTPFRIRTRVDIKHASELAVFLHCHDENQNRVFSSGSFFEPALNGVKLEAGLHDFGCEVPGQLLNDGEYTLDVMLVKDRAEVIVRESAIFSFRVHDEPLGVEGWNWPAAGVIRPRLGWSQIRVESTSSQ